MVTSVSLRDGIEHEVRDRIVSGRLPGGSRINEVHLAQELAVSRTPLREALTRLAGCQLLDARPRFGFYVRPLTAEEVRELYPIRARLDPWALELAGIPSREQLMELDDLNHALGGVREPSDAIDLDDRWHRKLLAGCPNLTLLELIRQMMWRTRRYEHLFFSELKHVAGAVREHTAILRALRKKDLAEACERLRDNMSTASPALIERLEAR